MNAKGCSCTRVGALQTASDRGVWFKSGDVVEFDLRRGASAGSELVRRVGER